MAQSDLAVRALSPAPYQYRPLIRGDDIFPEIRVLCIQPAKSQDEPLKCKICHLRLRDVPRNLIGDDEPDFQGHIKNGGIKYSALSYEWGKPMFDRMLHVEGSVIPITSNLDGALRKLRAYGVRRLWVDAICTYFDRSSIKNLRNRRCLIPHLEEPTRVPFGTRKFFLS